LVDDKYATYPRKKIEKGKSILKGKTKNSLHVTRKQLKSAAIDVYITRFFVFTDIFSMLGHKYSYLLRSAHTSLYAIFLLPPPPPTFCQHGGQGG
jgi:hypothetical protein